MLVRTVPSTLGSRCVPRRRILSTKLYGRRCYVANAENGTPNESRKLFDSDYDYCLRKVRELDPEHYFVSLIMPSSLRQGYIALRALNVELATLNDASIGGSSLQGTGPIKAQLWREAVRRARKGKGVHDSPVARQIGVAIKKYGLSSIWFKNLFDARERDVSDNRSIHTIQELEDFAEGTASSLLYLTSEICGIRDANVDHTLSHVGKAIGLCTILRGMPYHFRAEQNYIPSELLAKHGVSEDELFLRAVDPKIPKEELGRIYETEAFTNIVFDVACRANAHLKHARTLEDDIPKQSRYVCASAIVAGAYLEKLEKLQFRAFDPSLRPGSNTMLYPSLLYRKFWTKRFV